VIYSKNRASFLSEHPICEVCKKNKSTDIHHAKGRGKYLNNIEFFVGTCRECHDWIETAKEEAMIAGYRLDRIGHE